MQKKGYQSIPVDNILYSCGSKIQRSTEEFIEVHALAHVLSGELHFTTSQGVQVVKAGLSTLVKRNQLVKATKVPPPYGEFKSINIFFNQEVLRQYQSERNLPLPEGATPSLIYEFDTDPFLKGFFQSLVAYFETPARMTPMLAELKTKEAIELLLSVKPELSDALFDFSELYKIDLESFMLQNFRFNVPNETFAKLTGRSLASFKRDFEKIFHKAPGQWLKEKRLEEAYYLIKEKGIQPSVAYLTVGFENLSHFSYIFKQAYGVNPSTIHLQSH